MNRGAWLLLFALCCGPGCSGLDLLSVTPNTVPVGVRRPVLVSGVGVNEELQFSLEALGVEVALSPPVRVTDTEVEVWVPAAAPAGQYTLVATSPFDEDRLENAVELVDGRARVVFIDVGQGDATLVIAPEGETLLIDGGPRAAASRVQNALQTYAGGRLDAVVLSHYDADHLGGLVEVLAGPDRMPGTRDDLRPAVSFAPTDTGACNTVTCQRLRRLMAWPMVTASPLERFSLGTVDVALVAADGDVGEGPLPGISSDNEHSVAVQLSFGGRSVLITGDLTGGGLGTVDLETPLSTRTGPVDVLRVAHHGSATSSAASALERWQPWVAVLSVGTDNAYCHPASEVLERLSMRSARLYATGYGVVSEIERCNGQTRAPEEAVFGMGDVVLDVRADGNLWVNDDVIR